MVTDAGTCLNLAWSVGSCDPPRGKPAPVEDATPLSHQRLLKVFKSNDAACVLHHEQSGKLQKYGCWQKSCRASRISSSTVLAQMRIQFREFKLSLLHAPWLHIVKVSSLL